MIANSFMNMSGNNNEYHYQHDRGHSHLYHGHEQPRHIYDTTKIISTIQNFRRYDYTTEPMNSYSDTHFRRFNQYAQCTRRIRPNQENCALNQCTTTAPDCCPQITMCPYTCTETSCSQPVEEHTCFTPYIPPPPEPCACMTSTCPPISTNCNYNTNCCSVPCSTNTCCHTTQCPGPRRQNNDFNDYRRAGTLQDYDVIPNVVVRSGDQKRPPENVPQKGIPFIVNPDNNKSYKSMYDEKDSDLLIHKTDHPKYKSHERDYMYRSFNSGLRKKRQLEDEISVKPFWQIEKFDRAKPPQLKSMRFTTLKNIKNRKLRKNTVSAIWLTSTEPITLKLAEYADYQPEHITEKYLSFDELMHLRKISDGFANYDFRRQNKKTKKPDSKKPAGKKKPDNKKTTAKPDKKKSPDKDKTTKKPADTKQTTAKTEAAKTTKAEAAKTTATTKATTTTEYTANTPFERVKYCTRKLTCTWTAFTSLGEGDDSEGQVGPGIIEVGSRTPPGYVDGCTRTSTCTREYMDRNKISTITANPDEDSSGDPETNVPEDEDYCERRSLNVRRRNSETKKSKVPLLRYLGRNTNGPILTTDVHSDPDFISFTKESVTESVSNAHDCICNKKYARQKREESECSRINEDKCDNSRNSLSYSSIYYLVLNKILKSNEANKFYNKQCPCNSSISSNPVMFLFLLIVLNTFYL